ncbi:conserved hypothetical protein [Paecilomyces variotii No. 5]|uniref:DNA polymerase epsilon subunit B n=1 Tax=Byssochlamys spectabilis (strain No. 5 / NBRC 109023) TaxID=1356009 RepID=V5I4N8_BYSSN|nr:conserved hypothetical protein [Paecilomyces variotii No. 5]
MSAAKSKFIPSDSIPSSSPAFGTPVHPIRKGRPNNVASKGSVLPILLPPATLRPVAFRTITRKHNLTISSPALQTLATFIGKNCGSAWREEGLAERVLDEVAKLWKRAGGAVIVEEGNGASLQTILQTLESSMSAGRIVHTKVTAQDSRATLRRDSTDVTTGGAVQGGIRTSSGPADEEFDEENEIRDTRKWIKVIGAFDQPRFTYNVNKKHFETPTWKPSLFPPPSRKTSLFRDRYNLIYQRLLRNESFQSSLLGADDSWPRGSSSKSVGQQSYKLTLIANLLGRSGTSHLVLGLLSISPSGDLSITDLTGSIALDLTHARTVPEDSAWFAPGMVVLVDGIYEEEETVRGSTLGGNSGVGGTIGGRFVGISVGAPPCERREITLGMNIRKGQKDVTAGGFGWVDFLGVGSERAQGQRMRRIERQCLRRENEDEHHSTRRTMVVMSELNLDNVKTLEALREALNIYNSLPTEELPLVFFMIGNFVKNAVINGGGRGGSIEYKEYFDSLATALSEFPSLLRHSTFIFVPGDNDPWASAFSTGAATTIPRDGVPDMFTSRIKRAFTAANNDADASRSKEPAGEAIWTTNPARLSIFGPVHEIVVFRDDITGRLRRSSVISGTSQQPDIEMADGSGEKQPDVPETNDGADNSRPRKRDETPSAATLAARKLVKTVLDQGNVSPFPLTSRPVLWDYGSALHLYPLPTACILADAEAPPFSLTYEGCHVMNPGPLVPEGSKGLARWVEYDLSRNRGKVREHRY